MGGFLVTAGAAARKYWWVLALLAVVLVVAWIYSQGRDAGTAEADRSRLEGNAEALEQKAEADANASDARVKDAVRASVEAHEIEEAVDEAKLEGRDTRAAYYECVRLQQAARKSGGPAPEC